MATGTTAGHSHSPDQGRDVDRGGISGGHRRRLRAGRRTRLRRRRGHGADRAAQPGCGLLADLVENIRFRCCRSIHPACWSPRGSGRPTRWSNWPARSTWPSDSAPNRRGTSAIPLAAGGRGDLRSVHCRAPGAHVRSGSRWRTCFRSRFAAPWSIAIGRIGIRCPPGIAGSPWISRTPRPRAPTPWSWPRHGHRDWGTCISADGSGSTKDEHLVPGRGDQPCAEILEPLARNGFWFGGGRDIDPRGRPGAARSRSRRGVVLCPTASGCGDLSRIANLRSVQRECADDGRQVRRRNSTSEW